MLTCGNNLPPHPYWTRRRSWRTFCSVTLLRQSDSFLGYRVRVCGPGLVRKTERVCVCACVRPGASISGWTGWVGPLSPGPEVGWGWGVTRRDSLSPLRIREEATGERGVTGRAHSADLRPGATPAPRPERPLGLKRRSGGT